MEKRLNIETEYLFIPVCLQGQETLLEFFLSKGTTEKKLTELMVPVCRNAEKYDYFARFPVKQFIGQTLIVRGEVSKEFLKDLLTEEKQLPTEGKLMSTEGKLMPIEGKQLSTEGKPMPKKEKPLSTESTKREPSIRPSIHFTPEYGWMNDPNGLVYADGLYHLYFQYNPVNTSWNNMCWGHAVSKNLLFWKEMDIVLFPDENGMMFSGSAIQNRHEKLGLKKETLLFFYTAAGGDTKFSQGKKFTQRIAYSTDGGMTLRKMKEPFLPAIYQDNRDPKVFWHEESKAYIMCLWLRDNEFAILRSNDLSVWEQSDTLVFLNEWECPDLIHLQNKGCEDHEEYEKCRKTEEHWEPGEHWKNEEHEKYENHEDAWIFWSADGYYYFGQFDGYKFDRMSHQKKAELTDVSYAAQTYSNSGNRVVSIPWLRFPNKGEKYTGVMGIPRELSFTVINGEKQLVQYPVRELEQHRQKIYDSAFTSTRYLEYFHFEAGAVWMEIVCRKGTRPVCWKQNGTDFSYDSQSGHLTVAKKEYDFLTGMEEVSVLTDGRVCEIFIGHGIITGVFELQEKAASIYTDVRQYQSLRLYHITEEDRGNT